MIEVLDGEGNVLTVGDLVYHDGEVWTVEEIYEDEDPDLIRIVSTESAEEIWYDVYGYEVTIQGAN